MKKNIAFITNLYFTVFAFGNYLLKKVQIPKSNSFNRRKIRNSVL